MRWTRLYGSFLFFFFGFRSFKMTPRRIVVVVVGLVLRWTCRRCLCGKVIALHVCSSSLSYLFCRGLVLPVFFLPSSYSASARRRFPSSSFLPLHSRRPDLGTLPQPQPFFCPSAPGCLAALLSFLSLDLALILCSRSRSAPLPPQQDLLKHIVGTATRFPPPHIPRASFRR